MITPQSKQPINHPLLEMQEAVVAVVARSKVAFVVFVFLQSSGVFAVDSTAMHETASETIHANIQEIQL